MKIVFLTALLGACTLSAAYATNYYVSSGANSSVTGVNTTANGQGLSAAKPFATIQYAADLAQSPGDVVYIRAGTYTGGSSVLNVKYSGSASAPITFRNYPADAQKPLLQFSSWYGVYIGEDVSRPGFGVSYVEVIGLRVQGNNRNLTLAGATNQPLSCANPTGSYDPRYNGSGIVIKGTATIHPHHIRIAENEVFECPGGGMGSARADYITIENNLVYNTAWYTVSGGSGISTLGGWDFDKSTTGYRTIIRNNVVFGNKLLVPWFTGSVCQGITDGNGIIVDSNRNFGYTGRTLIANNLVVDNGGAGITFFQSNDGDIINNTLYHNSKSPELSAGDLVLAYASNVLAQNNLSSASAGKATVTVKVTTDVTLNANLLFGGTGFNGFNNTRYANTNALAADPQLARPTTDWRTADFAPKPGSPALDQGVNNRLPATDLTGRPRVAGPLPDLGAYEYQLPLAAAAGAGPLAGLVAWPNPMAGRATLRYVLPRAGTVRLEVLDALGRLVARLVDGEQPAGPHEVEFVAPVATGLYHVRLTTPNGRTQLALAQLP